MVCWTNVLDRMGKAVAADNLNEMESSISLELHSLEEDGVDVPRGVDAFWELMTTQIQGHH